MFVDSGAKSGYLKNANRGQRVGESLREPGLVNQVKVFVCGGDYRLLMFERNASRCLSKEKKRLDYSQPPQTDILYILNAGGGFVDKVVVVVVIVVIVVVVVIVPSYTN